MWLVDTILYCTDVYSLTLQKFKEVCLQQFGAPPILEPSVTSSVKVNSLYESNFELLTLQAFSPERKPRKDRLDSLFFFICLSVLLCCSFTYLFITHLLSSSLQFCLFVVAGSLSLYNPLRVRLARINHS